MATPSFYYNSVHIAPWEQIGLHSQDSWELSYVIIGAGERTVGDVTEIFGGGDLVLIPPGVPHQWSFRSDVTDNRGRIANISVMWEEDFLNRCAQTIPELEQTMEKLLSLRTSMKFAPTKAAQISHLLLQMREMNKVQRFAHMVEIFEILASQGDTISLGSYKRQTAEQLKKEKIIIYINCNYNRPITLDMLAQHIGMNRSALCVFFKRAFGESFTEYLNKYRIWHACNRLKESSTKSIADICFEVGFGDVPYFNRVFKKVKGISPKQWKQFGE